MSRARSFFKYWLPVLIWMCIIFTASADTHSAQHSSRIIAPILHWLFPQMPTATVDQLVFYARKCAHLTEYAIFALLLWRAFRKFGGHDLLPWSWPLAGRVIIIVALYASSDEFHQLFVRTREPRIHDVVIDTIGGCLGLTILWLFGRRQKFPAHRSLQKSF